MHIFPEEINKIALSLNDDEGMLSTDSISACAFRTSKYLVSEKVDIKCYKIIKRQKKLINFYDVTKEKKEHNPNLPKNPDHPCRTLTDGVLDLQKRMDYLIQ